MGPTFVGPLPVAKFHGIGPATAARFEGFGIRTGLDMRNQTLEFLEANFGKSGSYWISRGVDHRPVRPDRVRKSVGAENTFARDLTRLDEMVPELEPLRGWRKKRAARTVSDEIRGAVMREGFYTRSQMSPIDTPVDAILLKVSLKFQDDDV